MTRSHRLAWLMPIRPNTDYAALVKAKGGTKAADKSQWADGEGRLIESR